MCAPSPPGPSSTRACSWWASSGSSTRDLHGCTECESAIALVHSRFSTNTTPSWERAHPNRLHPPQRGDQHHPGQRGPDAGQGGDHALAPACPRRTWARSCRWSPPAGSDSAMLDNTLEFLMMNGIPLPLAVMMSIPEPWAERSGPWSREKRDYLPLLLPP